MSLRKEGASKGATTSFLIATPQTGVDSILATASLLGVPFAILRPAAALVNTSTNRSRVFWLGVIWNYHSYKPLGGQKKQEEDRSVIRIGE